MCRNLMRLVVLASVLCLGGSAASGACVTPPSGLVGWWRAENNVQDTVGTHHGVLTNGAHFAAGQMGQAFGFDGVNDMAVIPDAPALSPHVGPNGEMTVAAWVRIENYPAYDLATAQPGRAILMKGQQGVNEYGLGIRTNGEVVFIVYQPNGANYSGTFDETPVSRLTLQKWHHVAGTLRKGVFVRAYLDGVLVREDTTFVGDTGDGPDPLTIGGRLDGLFIDGLVDEVVLYNRALSAAEIVELYAAGRCPAPTITVQPVGGVFDLGNSTTLNVAAAGEEPVSFQWLFNGTNVLAAATNAALTLTNLQLSQAGLYSVVAANSHGSHTSIVVTLEVVPCLSPPLGLVGWWRGEGNGLDAGGRFPATLGGDSRFATGRVGQAFQFNGTPTHLPSAFQVLVPPHAALSPHANDTGETGIPPDPYSVGEMSIEAWINIPALPVGEYNETDHIRFVVRKLSGIGCEYGLFVATNGQAGFAVCRFGGQSFEARGGLVTTNQWHHLVGTYKKLEYVRIYLDGVLVSELPSPQFSGSVTPSVFDIGHGGFFNGRIDEVALFRRALSGNEIAALYAARGAGKCPPGPAGTPVVWVNGVYHPENSALVTNSALIELGNTFLGGTIRYTLDGSPPSGGIVYTGAFVLPRPGLVRAIAYAADFSSLAESDSVLVDVVHPPFIITQPQGRTVGAGASVGLSVFAGGTDPLSYQWHRNGVAVPAATDATLLLPAIQPSQGGDYTVVITNDFGSVTSAVAQVVVFAPPSFLSQPASVRVSVGGTATFTVSALGPPPLEFQWRKNGANIAGATNSTLTITNVQLDDGASYSVVVASPGGTLVSDPALLNVTVPSPPAGDDFASTNMLEGASGSATGTNNFATREPGEPLHAGKPGSNSVWYSWTAPATGIATFRTTGSTFDTLLGIYTGGDVAGLTTIVSDEDSGGFLASRASFNASNGVTYHIAIDGLNGQQGGYVLRWELVVTTDTVPEIICPPASVTVLPGQNATFTVSATGSTLAYQWLLNGTNIAGATNAVYTRTNARPEHVGFCSVKVTSASGQTVESAPALLEIGPDPGVQSRDKPDDVDAACPGMFGPAAGASSVAMGSIGYQLLVSTSTNNLIDCNTTNCGGIPTGSRYMELQPSANGTFILDTTGSASRTKLWVCRAGTNNLDKTRTYLTCDVDGAPDGRSIVSFPAEGGRTYQVWISKLDNTNGVLQLNWKLGLPPRIASLSSNRFLLEGSTTTLSVNATNVIAAGVAATNALSAPTYAWYFNGSIPVGTGPNLILNNLQAGAAGSYLVVAANEVGATTAVVRVEVFGLADQMIVPSGGGTELYADATTAACGGAPAHYQWRHNGGVLTGQTNRSLFLSGTQAGQAGQYSVTVSNCFGTATYTVATVSVTVDVGFVAQLMPNGQVVLSWLTTPGKHYRVEHRPTLDSATWTPLQPDLLAATSTLTVMDTPGAEPRFYRIVLLD